MSDARLSNHLIIIQSTSHSVLYTRIVVFKCLLRSTVQDLGITRVMPTLLGGYGLHMGRVQDMNRAHHQLFLDIEPTVIAHGRPWVRI